MKPQHLAILLITVLQTPAVGQIRTTVKARCDIFSDSSLLFHADKLNRNDSVVVSRFYAMTGAYLVTHKTVEGYVHFRNLKDGPELTAMRGNASQSGKAEMRRSRPKNNLAFNAFGDASSISAGYERLVFLYPSFFLAAGLGIGVRSENVFDFYVTMPYHVTANFGSKKHFAEFGIGFTTDLFGAELNSHDNMTFRYVIVGYRFQPTISKLGNRRKLSFRINLLYFNSEGVTRGLYPIGIAIGRSF